MFRNEATRVAKMRGPNTGLPETESDILGTLEKWKGPDQSDEIASIGCALSSMFKCPDPLKRAKREDYCTCHP